MYAFCRVLSKCEQVFLANKRFISDSIVRLNRFSVYLNRISSDRASTAKAGFTAELLC